MKRSSACSLKADESRLPREGCSLAQAEKVGLRVSRKKVKARCNARPHPAPLLQERENRPPHDQYSNDWTYRTRIVTTGGGGKPFLLLGEKARMRASGEKAGWQAPANRPRKSLISTIVSLIFTSLDAWGARPARKAGRSYVVPTARSRRGASRAPLRQDWKMQACGWRDANHRGRDNRAPHGSHSQRRVEAIRQTVPWPSSVTSRAPSCATVMPTGRPQTLRSSTTKPVMKSSYWPVATP